MYILILLLFLLAFVSFAFQMTLIRRKWMHLLLYTAIGIGIYLAYPSAIEQSFTKFQEAVTNQDLISNFLVVQIVECIIGLLFCIYLIRDFFKEKVLRVFRYFKIFPGMVIVPAIFYFESFGFLSFYGIDFKILAIVFAIIIPLLFLGMQYLLIVIIPEYDLRLELKFILHILQLVLAVVLSIKIYAIPVQSSLGEMNLMPLLGLVILSLIMGAIGIWRQQHQLKKLKKES